MSGLNVHPLLQQWHDAGWLRAIDVAFAGLLMDLANEQQPSVLVAAALTSFQLGSGHVCVDLQALLQHPEVFLPPVKNTEGDPGPGWRPFLQTLQTQGLSAWQQQLRASPAVGAGEGAEPLVLDGHRLYLRRYWRYETQVAKALLARLATPAVDLSLKTLPPGHLVQALDALFEGATDAPDWQRIATAIASRQRFVVISGGPGTGKTTTVVRLLSLLQGLSLQSRGKPLRIALAAPTGKAAARLTESIGKGIVSLPHQAHIPTQVSTLHRLIGARSDTRDYRWHRGNPLHVDILVIDEASMVDLEMMAAVVDALPVHARLILLGDKDQLASVEAGAILGEICRDAHLARYSADLCRALQRDAAIVLPGSRDAQPLDDHMVMLKKSHRFLAQGRIGKLALAINEGDVQTALDLLAAGDPSGDPSGNPSGNPQAVFLLTDRIESTLAPLVLGRDDGSAGYAAYLQLVKAGCPAQASVNDWAQKVLETLGRFQVLCALRQGDFGVESLNPLIARVLFDAGLIPHTQGWYAGRPVMVTRNDYSLGLMNGDVGVALPDPDADLQLRVFFAQANQLKRVLPSRLTQVETVFAMTVHKSQGSEFDHAVLVLPASVSPVLTRELIYTAVTRAKHRVTLTGERLSVLETALRQRVFRCSGLWERLQPAQSRPATHPQQLHLL